jgi:polyisoprenoid-binding protein YceI
MKTKYIFYITLMTILGLLFTASNPVAAADVYKVDPVHSAISFKIKHLGISYVRGRFNNAAGTITFDPKVPAKSSVEISVKVDDIDTFNAKRDKHLRSPDFFHAKKYPLITFRSETVKSAGEGTYEVGGQLSFHGVTRPLTVQVTHIGSVKDPWGGYRAGFETEFKVKRSDFGMTKLMNSAGDEVHLSINIEGIRK